MKENQASNGDGSFSVEFLYYQIIDFLLTAPFLVIFIYRLFTLKPLSSTNKYKKFFPRFRVILSLAFIAISIALLIFNIVDQMYPSSEWYNYILGGGGGPCLNSIVLIFQLLVLRSQLIKEIPYTPYHLLFFILLAVASIIRLVLIFYLKSLDVADIVLSSLLTLVSIVQLIYWAIKRQSLPQFLSYGQINIDSLMNNQIIKAQFKTEKNVKKSLKDDFSYFIPLVSVQRGQMHITLQVYKDFQKRNSFQSDLPEEKANSNRSPLVRSEHQRDSQFGAVSNELYTLEELKNLYILCHRFPLKKEINIELLELPELAKEFQEFLDEVLEHKSRYQPEILKQLKLTKQDIKKYQYRGQKKESNLSNIGKERFYDPKIGKVLPEDLNAIYCSARVYKHMWISNHYEFYIRAAFASAGVTSYPIKRYSEFQELHTALKNIIKSLGKSLQLPFLPKKHLFHWNETEYVRQRKQALEKYLRWLTNDYTLMQIPEIRHRIFLFLQVPYNMVVQSDFKPEFFQGLKVKKGEITKVIVKSEYVTFYEFRIFQSRTDAKLISKRYSDFEELHHEMQRWMNNIRTKFNFLEMPERIMFKSEADRHEKLKSYIQVLVQVNEVYKVYAVNSFLNVGNNQSDHPSELSQIEAQSRSIMSHSKVQYRVIELQERKSKQKSSRSSNISKMLDDLGNENYD